MSEQQPKYQTNTNTNGSAKPTPATFTEAPASLNFRFDYRGATGIQLTLRDVSGGALLGKIDAVIDHLEKMGATFSGGSGSAPTPPAPAGAPTCPTHGKPMKQSQHGGWFCPHKIADDDGAGKPIYCKQKVNA
jgi:hypothetical protein